MMRWRKSCPNSVLPNLRPSKYPLALPENKIDLGAKMLNDSFLRYFFFGAVREK
jgi:hypothetical protein